MHRLDRGGSASSWRLDAKPHSASSQARVISSDRTWPANTRAMRCAMPPARQRAARAACRSSTSMPACSSSVWPARTRGVNSVTLEPRLMHALHPVSRSEPACRVRHLDPAIRTRSNCSGRTASWASTASAMPTRSPSGSDDPGLRDRKRRALSERDARSGATIFSPARELLTVRPRPAGTTTSNQTASLMVS